MRFRASFGLSWTLLTGLVAGQEPAFRAEVEVVQVLASVRDAHGSLVQGLTQDDFVLEEDGKPREIEYFSQESDLPLTLGLLVDTSMSQRRILGDERKASYQFFDQILDRETDRAFVLSFDVDVELLEDSTHSRELLQGALDRLSVPSEPGRAGIGTVLYDAVFLAAGEVLPPESRRPALIIISDGVDMGSLTSLQEAVTTAHKADAIIYAIRYYDDRMYRGRTGGFGAPGGPGWGGGRGGGRPPSGRPRPPAAKDGKKVLEELASQTGGRLFETGKKQSLQDTFRQIEEELRHQYSIGFTPGKLPQDNRFRSIRLRTVRRDLTVQCRSGYFPAKSGP